MSPEVDGPAGQVEVFGIRHHGPGSARSLLSALAEFGPDAVLVEGPADADPLLDWVLNTDLQPPVALLAYAPDRPTVAAFWPYAVFSPEWQAVTWAARRGIEVAFCDLPAAQMLARQPRTLLETTDESDEDEDGGQDDTLIEDGPEPDHDRALARTISADPLKALAEAAGYDDAERWWEDVVELRWPGDTNTDAADRLTSPDTLGGTDLDSARAPFVLINEAMAELRRIVGQPVGRAADRERRREAYMRQTIRNALKRGRQRVAVVCGAWHGPALSAPLGPAAADARILRGGAKRKVALTWVPWTHQRLASGTGYGAGVSSPGWYHHLWSAPDRAIVRWLTAVAQALRTKDLPVSSAHVIEAVRLAETLAALRNRPLAGLAEVTEATRAVLCDGDELAVRFVTDALVVGQALGAVPADVPTVPLEADLARTCRTLRLRREPQVRVHDLDLRKPTDHARSRLFHRLRLLDLPWAIPAESAVTNQGTFRETWQTGWQPEYAINVVEAAVWGTTVPAAAAARVAAITERGTLVELARAVERCLLAELPGALDALLTRVAEQAALDVDVIHLMDALPALARAQRYGDVRRTETGTLRRVSDVMVIRICAGLPQAVGHLDDDHASAMRDRIDAVNAAVGLIVAGETDTGLRERWLATLGSIVDRADVHGRLLGRVTRLLLDAERLADVGVRVERALSHGVPATEKAGFVDGFFADGALLLIHDPVLRELLDGWVGGLAPTEFTEVLPLVRRTFATFSPAQRQAVGAQMAAGGGAVVVRTPAAYDLERAAPAVATVELILAGRHG